MRGHTQTAQPGAGRDSLSTRSLCSAFPRQCIPPPGHPGAPLRAGPRPNNGGESRERNKPVLRGRWKDRRAAAVRPGVPAPGHGSAGLSPAAFSPGGPTGGAPAAGSAQLLGARLLAGLRCGSEVSSHRRLLPCEPRRPESAMRSHPQDEASIQSPRSAG